MTEERRTDVQQKRVVDAAIRVDALWGCVTAWGYLRERGVSRDVALRILSRQGRRRNGETAHAAQRHALAQAAGYGTGQSVGAATGTVQRRSNVAAAFAVERAIEFSLTAGRHYAESLLRIYSLDTVTVMRVLFEPERRRRRK